MKVSKAQAAENREGIVDAAARFIEKRAWMAWAWQRSHAMRA
jgi:hypothetical protein